MDDLSPDAPCGATAIVLPAGYGKTEYIADYASQQSKKTLVLTHTNAGVYALRKRLGAKDVESGYHVTTIASWCESWVSSYPDLTQFETFAASKEDDSGTYFKRLYETMLTLASKPWVKKTLRISYGCIMVDEYQDCTLTQHALFQEMAQFMHVTVLGDPLQGVFYWAKDDPIIDWRNLGFPILPYESKPWRWINAGSLELGEYIGEIRGELLPVLQGHDTSVTLDRGCADVTIVSPEYIARMQNWDGYGSIAYVTNKKHVQYAFSKQHRRFQANEAVDNTDAKRICALFDSSNGTALALATLSFASTCFTGINQGLKSYKARLERGNFDFGRMSKFPAVKNALLDIQSEESYASVHAVLTAIKTDKAFRLHRGVLFHEVLRALRLAIRESVNATKALDMIRAQGRSFEERSPYQFVSSRTVLSKGLEYDTAIVDAVNLTDARDFYVAISRCKRKLIIVSPTRTLSFHGIPKDV